MSNADPSNLVLSPLRNSSMVITEKQRSSVVMMKDKLDKAG